MSSIVKDTHCVLGIMYDFTEHSQSHKRIQILYQSLWSAARQDYILITSIYILVQN